MATFFHDNIINSIPRPLNDVPPISGRTLRLGYRSPMGYLMEFKYRIIHYYG
jgi:hypothetical protein